MAAADKLAEAVDRAVVNTVAGRSLDTVVGLVQHSKLPTVELALVVAIADTAHTHATASNMRSAHPRTWWRTAPATSACLAVVTPLDSWVVPQAVGSHQ